MILAGARPWIHSCPRGPSSTGSSTPGCCKRVFPGPTRAGSPGRRGSPTGKTPQRLPPRSEESGQSRDGSGPCSSHCGKGGERMRNRPNR